VNSLKKESSESENSGQSPTEDRSQIPPKNIFKKEEMNYAISAIYLNKAVINGEAVEVGQPVGKAKLKEIRSSSIVIEEENGETRTIEMFQGGVGGENQEPSMNEMMPPNQPSGMGRMSSGRAITRTSGSQPMGIPPGITIKGINADRYRNMSSEERKNFRNNLSASDRERLKQQMQQARQSRNR